MPLTPAVREPEGGSKGTDGNSNSWRIKKATRTQEKGAAMVRGSPKKESAEVTMPSKNAVPSLGSRK